MCSSVAVLLPAGSSRRPSRQGWETSRFVGLDLVPGFVPPSMLDELLQGRASFLRALPFSVEEFDYFRIACVNSGTYEHRWDPLIEELREVLAPGRHSELLDTVTSLYAPRPILRNLMASRGIRSHRSSDHARLKDASPPTLAMNELPIIKTFWMPSLWSAAGEGRAGHE